MVPHKGARPMSSALRVSLFLLALSASLPLLASLQCRSLASPTEPRQSSDEEIVRGLTEQYGLAIAASDLEKMRQFWNPQSQRPASRLGSYKDLFLESRIEFISLKVTR